LKNILQLKLYTRSLFFRLLISFLIIILLLTVFSYFSFTISKKSINEEVIRYNNLNLKNTTDSYEKHFQLINNVAVGFFVNRLGNSLDLPNIDYIAAKQMSELLQTHVRNSPLYLDNLILFYKDSKLVLDSSRGGRLDTFFNQNKWKKDLPLSFWQQQFSADYNFKLFPENQMTDPLSNASISNKMLPMIIRSKIYSNVYVAALFDSSKLFEAYHHSINNKFYILDPNGQQIFNSDVSEIDNLPQFHDTEGYTKQGEFYLFFKKGSFSGLTYVNIIPIANIVSQANRYNVTLLLLLLVSIAISVIASILFSMRFNNPVKKMVEAMQQLNTHTPFSSKIQEFEILGNKVTDMIKANQDINQDLSKKNSLLRNYAYSSKLKNILGNLRGFDDLTSSSTKPFRFVLFQLNFKLELTETLKIDEEYAIYSLKEFISHYMIEPFPDSHTFLIEKYEVLTLINHQENEPDPISIIQKMKLVFDLDHDYFFTTIAISSIYKNAADFTIAYEEVLDLLKQRHFNDQTQIITEKQQHESIIVFSPSQEQEFDVNLAAGNETIILPLVKRQLALMAKKELSYFYFIRFSEEIIRKVTKALLSAQLDYYGLDQALSPTQLLKQCCTLEQLELFIELYLTSALKQIKEKKEKHNHIIHFVTTYVLANYAKDITLESVADKLNITGGYLSTYFKEKRGMNFNDYVNSVRIEMAQNYLKHSNLKIQEVASKVGYQNLNSFNRMFRKFSGVTPSDYRRDNQASEQG
jgi:two-component system response regulator YesN